jgi:3-mercaptopyruvate sulfurtransferase SseA
MIDQKKDKVWVVLDCSVGLEAERSYKRHRIEGAHYLNFGELKCLDYYCYVLKVCKISGALQKQTGNTNFVKDRLIELGIGTNSNVICYDQDDGVNACKAAVFIKASGVTNVRVLNEKFQKF